MLDCFGLDVLYDFLQLPYCFAKEMALVRAQKELAACQSRAEEGVRASVAAQEYEGHRHKLMLLRDGHQGAPRPAQSQWQHQSQLTPRQPTPTPTQTPTPATQAGAAPPSAGLCSTPYPAPTQKGSSPKRSGAVPSLTSPPRLAPPPSGGVQLQVTPRTAPVAAPPLSQAGSLSIASNSGMDANIDDSFFGDDDDGPGYPTAAAAGSVARGRQGDDGAVMGLLALDEPE